MGLILSVMPFILANYSVDLTAVYQGNNGACEVEPVNGYTLTATGGAEYQTQKEGFVLRTPYQEKKHQKQVLMIGVMGGKEVKRWLNLM